MKRSLVLSLCACVPLCASSLEAQSQSEPNLVFSISLGLTTGKELWTIDEQQMAAPGAAGTFDTVSLGRRLKPSLTGSVSATLYSSPNFGWTAEVGYFGVGSEQRCSGPAVWQPDGQNVNQQACERAQGQQRATSVVGFQFGGHYRFNPNGRVQPYVRLTAGPGLLGNNFVQTSGAVIATPACSPQPCEYRIIDERDRKTLTWLVTGALGFTFTVAPAYRVRMEFRDILTSLPLATGPAPVSANGTFAPTGRKAVHVPTFLFGVDLVFERRHTRRY